MKKLHLLLLKSYLGPFVLTLFIVMFILLMQFVWKHIDDFMGKGLEYAVIAELLIYASANLVSLALPLAVLLSSIMTFGNLAEHYELVAMKSSGLSLIRIMRPLIVFIISLSIGAFYFNNVIAPIATLKFKSLLWDITQAKPSLELREGVFYNGIETYSIRIGTKDKNSNKLGDVLIYQHEKTNPGNYRVIRAKSGEMVKSANDRAMTLILYDGVSYEEAGRENDKDHPLIQSKFQSDIIRIDLSGFDMQRTDEDLWKNHMKMMSMNQLTTSIDSLQSQSNQRSTEVEDYFANSITTPLTSDSGHMASTDELIFEKIDPKYQRNTLNVALNVTRNNKNFLERTIAEMDNRREYINKHKIEWHRKLTLSFACIILFFIGAPLGAIIKKGGLGLPVVFSVVFFLIFHITSISGEKMVDSGVLSPFGGMWLSSMILLPIAVFLTYKAAKDAPIFDGDTYTKLFDRIKSRFNKSQSVAA